MSKKLNKLILGTFIIIVFLSIWKYEYPIELEHSELSRQMIHGTFSDDVNLTSFNYDFKECHLNIPNLQLNEKPNFKVLDSNIIYLKINDTIEFLCFFDASRVKLVNISNDNMIITLPRKDDRVVTYSN